MASFIATMVGGALVNAFAFSGSNYLFKQLDNTEEERKRHDKAMEKYTSDRDKWNKKRLEILDFENKQRMERMDYKTEKLEKQKHSSEELEKADKAMQQYFLETEPKFENYYTPSNEQKDRELTFVVVGMAIIGFISFKYL